MATKTKYRVTKCLMNDCVRECAITSDGKKHIIEETKDGEKYFRIDNPYKNDTLLERHFHGRIGDAIQSIRDGYADVILSRGQMNVFTQFAYPVVMIDKELGEKYRQKSINEFKDAEVGYSIYYGSKNSFGGYYPTAEDGDMAIFKDFKIYDTEEEAQEILDNYIKEATKLAKNAIGENGEFKDIPKDNIPSIINDIAWDMIEELPDDKVKLRDDLKILPNIGFEIRQMIEVM